MRALDLNLLRVLVALADEGSVSAAARAVGLSQPALSAALARLREYFGEALFVRSARGMQATPRADALVEAARRALSQIDREVLAPADFAAEAQQGVLTLALSDVGEVVFLPRLIERLAEIAPMMSVRSVTLSPKRTAEGLEAGSIDLAVGYFPDLTGQQIFRQRLFTHHFHCLLRADHPIRARRLTLAQFQRLGHAVVRAEGRSQELFERFLAERQIKRRVALETPHFLSIPFILARTDLLATVPHAVGLAFSRSHANIRMIEPPFALPRFDLKQHWHRRFHTDARSVWLRQTVSQLYNDGADEWREAGR